MAPLVILVEGTPKSVQSRRRDRWKAAVGSATQLAMPAEFEATVEPVEVRLLFCFEETNLDADNIVKPIVDALAEAGAFVDDSQVADLIVSLRTFEEAAELIDPPPALPAALGKIAGDFVLIFVHPAAVGTLP